MDTILNVIFGLYGGLFTVLWFIMKSQAKLKDATIEHLNYRIKQLQEDTDPAKWKARFDLNRKISEEEIAELKQQKDSASQEKVKALEVVKGLTTEILATRQMLTELQNQYNASIVKSGSANLEALGTVTGTLQVLRAVKMSEEKKLGTITFGNVPSRKSHVKF